MSVSPYPLLFPTVFTSALLCFGIAATQAACAQVSVPSKNDSFLALEVKDTTGDAISRGEILSERLGCHACHTEREALVGPSFAAIATRNHKVERIAELIRQPEPANWPEFEAPMPPFGNPSDRELLDVATWINSLK